MKYFSIVLFWIGFMPVQIFAQSSNSIWIFGKGCGLNFNSAKPTLFNINKNVDLSNSAVLTDEKGDLQFFTDGDTVWNASLTPMANGKNLIPDTGDPEIDQTQRGAFPIIVPKSLSSNQYYLISLWHASNNQNNRRLYYSIIDLDLINGSGDVLPQSKSSLIRVGNYFSMAVSPGNCDTIWLLTTLSTGSEIHIFPVTSTNIGAPLIHQVEYNFRVIYNRGDVILTRHVKDKKFIIAAIKVNKSMGALTFDYSISLKEKEKPRSVCISVDRSKLYVITDSPLGSAILQYDLTFGDNPAIENSRFEVANYPEYANSTPFNKMELGPDGKIYFAAIGHDEHFVHSIESPDQPGKSCSYNSRRIDLSECIAGITFSNDLAFPNQVIFPPGFHIPALDLLDSFMCTNETMTIGTENTFDNYQWNTGQATSYITIQEPGEYILDANLDGCKVSDTSSIQGWIPVDDIFGQDTVLCENEILSLNIFDENADQYLWSDSSVHYEKIIEEPIELWAQISDEYCNFRDHLSVDYNYLDFTLGNDTTLCSGEVLTIGTELPDVSYLWNTGSTKSEIVIDQSGYYELEVRSGNCTYSNGRIVDYYPVLELDLGADTSYCSEDQKSVILSVRDDAFVEYNWNTGQLVSNIEVNETSHLILNASDGHCWASDSILIEFERCSPCHFYIPNIFTPNNDGINDYFQTFPACDIIEYHLRIFNRLGGLIYESHDPLSLWDGNFADKLASEGVYVYTLISTSNETGKPVSRSFRGNVTLIR